MKTLTLAQAVVAFSLLAAAASPDDAPAPPRQQQIIESAQKIKELRQERLTALKDLADGAGHLAKQGRASIDEACEARLVAFRAELELAERPADRVAVCQNVVDVLQQYEELAKAQKAAARGTELSVLKAKAGRLEAEIRLVEVKAKLAEASK